MVDMVRDTQTHQKEKKPQDNDIQKSANSDGSFKDESRRLFAELLGTFALTLVAAGGEVIAVISGGEVNPAARAVAPGLLVMAMIYTLGSQSGAHFNPVVTLAFTLSQDFPWRRYRGRTGRWRSARCTPTTRAFWPGCTPGSDLSMSWNYRSISYGGRADISARYSHPGYCHQS